MRFGALIGLAFVAACGFSPAQHEGVDGGASSDAPDASDASCGPTTCDDGMACTTDTLVGSGCTATCEYTPVTAPIDGDGCCPAGANPNTDSDCIAACGDGIVETGELCDTGIAAGAGACPTSCDDGDACTTDALVNGGSCQATCVHTPITMAHDGDGCCPAGATAATDDDCVAGPTAFRFTALALRDPHVFVNVGNCFDFTDAPATGSLDGLILKSMQSDANHDGLLDQSPTVVFRPLNQGAAATIALDLDYAACTAPLAATSCTPGSVVAHLTASNMTAGQCLGAIAGTTHGYSPAITATTGPCFVSSPTALALSLDGIPLPLHDASVAATYSGDPATHVINGLVRGFLTQTDADATTIPNSFLLIGGHKLSSLLPGGTSSCASYSDKDVDNSVAGWWIYLNFSASTVTWAD